MLALPMIGREFRAASRRKRFYWMRAALGALLVFALLIAGAAGAVFQTRGSGAFIFRSMATILFMFVTVMMIAQSCGAVADERRQGTLGLLLLTPLRPSDIVLGKFIARICEGLQLCLVSLPMIFVAFALGGLTGSQLFASFIVILSQMLLCAGAAILASACFRNAASAFIAAAVVVAGVEGLLFLALQSAGWLFPKQSAWMVLNPLSMLVQQFGMGPGDMTRAGLTLAVASVACIVMLILAVQRIPETLDETAVAERWPRQQRPRRAWRHENRPDRTAPVYWLEWGRWKSRRNFNLGVGAALVLASALWLSETVAGALYYLGIAANLILSLTMAVSMVRDIQVQKQDRSLELLLTTPIADEDWINQRLKAAWNAFGVPLLILSVLSTLPRFIVPVFSGRFDPVLFLTLTWMPFSALNALATWYMLATIALSVGLAARTMTGAITTLVLILFVSTVFCVPVLPGLVAGWIAHRGLRTHLRSRAFE
ncbi:MAG: ABC transporter permease subunit [Verrucomicrobia bacterium]|nr:ABC transporter permease subunit [Verrucomicrobiota bacterium]